MFRPNNSLFQTFIDEVSDSLKFNRSIGVSTDAEIEEIGHDLYTVAAIVFHHSEVRSKDNDNKRFRSLDN